MASSSFCKKAASGIGRLSGASPMGCSNGWPSSPNTAPRADMNDYDAIVVGAGPNGLVAANHQNF